MRLGALLGSDNNFTHDAGDLPAFCRARDSVHTSFLRRCWWPARDCKESSTCADMRSLYESAEHVEHLPPPGQCENPKYIVTGDRHRFGFMAKGRLESLAFPDEEWHKCCMLEEGTKMICEDVQAMSNAELLNLHHGMCGTHACMGPAERCLHVDHQTEDLTAPKPGQCPQECDKACTRSSERLECVHLGEITQDPGSEGDHAEKVKGEYNQPEKYEVFSLSMPACWTLPPLPTAAKQSERKRAWRHFLA
eukprot:TRINITY_DN40673_c0_g1_i1.p1 TRINITY_DN40673_c0_g1~~TRINITY_DN40673_c0_g1_i1.p1  ORF type:complete len:250 (+),score=52.01 TRINITY_DN40673_c0_g1_i1:112-861(+)